ncbi:MAG: OmpH family outer membrane protein [Planctomycetes bacterium]|nr:OmpH family outer membrane protein [Planctomycetota bacterium]
MAIRRLPQHLGLSAAFLLGAISVIAGPAAVGAPQGAAPKIAVIDMDLVLKAYPHAEARLAGLTGMIEKTKDEMKALEASYAEAKARSDVAEKGTEEAARSSLDLEIARQRFEAIKEIRDAALSRKRLETSVGLWDEISEGIGAFAKAKGIEVVLRWRNTPASAGPSQKFETMQAKDVVWVDAAKVDVTAQVIEFLKSWPGPSK